MIVPHVLSVLRLLKDVDDGNAFHWGFAVGENRVPSPTDLNTIQSKKLPEAIKTSVKASEKKRRN